MKIKYILFFLIFLNCGTTLMYHTNVQNKLKDGRKGVMLEKNSPDLPTKSEAAIFAGEDIWIYDSKNKDLFNKASNGYLILAPGDYVFEVIYYHLNRKSIPTLRSIKIKPYQTAVVCKGKVDNESVEILVKIVDGFIYETEDKSQHCKTQ